jgi:hypothetical protein
MWWWSTATRSSWPLWATASSAVVKDGRLVAGHVSGSRRGWQEVGDRVYRRRYESLDLNVGAVVGAGEVLVVDTRSFAAEAAQLLADLRALTRSPAGRWSTPTPTSTTASATPACVRPPSGATSAARSTCAPGRPRARPPAALAARGGRGADGLELDPPERTVR